VKRIKFTYQLLIFLGYLGISYFVQRDIISSYPHHIHAWAHTDHYALSQGFIDNNFDFFHPQTHTANKQFPSKENPAKQTRITSSDFPAVQFLAAVWMKISGNESPIVYRLWMLIIACIGLLYLFKIAYHFSSNYLVSIVLPLVLLFNPIYLDYQVGFLPSMAAMSLLFIGLYFYLLHKENGEPKKLIIAVFWLSLATAIRTPFAIPLIAILATEGLSFLRKMTSFKSLLIILAGFLLPVSYFFYNQHLRAVYGSIFLGRPLPARNLEEFESNLLEASANWFNHYLSDIHWVIAVYLFLALPTVLIIRQNIPTRYKSLIQLTCIYGMGVMAYLVLMSQQMVHHDYYALDTFLPLFYVVAIVSISIFVKQANSAYFFSLVLVVMGMITVPNTLETLAERRSPGSSQPYSMMLEDYSHLNEFLGRNNIDPTTEIMVIDNLAPNMPFVMSDYRGTNIMELSHFNAGEILSWDYDYIVIRDDNYYNDILGMDHDIMAKTNLIDYGFGLFLLKNNPNTQPGKSLNEWLDFDPNQPSKIVEHYENISDISLDENALGTCDTEFALTYRDTLSKDNYKLMKFECNLQKTQDTEALWHIHIRNDKEELFNEYVQIPSTPTTMVREIILPRDLNTWYISSYLYNPNNNTIHYQDFRVKYY
jgi:hypothetical protein